MQPENLSTQHSDPAAQRWCDELQGLIGLSQAEVEARRAVLLQFCQAQACAPAQLVAECRSALDGAERLAHYLQLASASPANLIVQSFLIHNGVNVFGAIVCMPSSPDQLRAEQGEQWERLREG